MAERRSAGGRAAAKQRASSGSGAATGPRKRPPYRREMIFTAAAELFRQQGYHGTRIEDIGAAVGMTGPAVYRHFPKKEALLAALLEREIERATEQIRAVLEEARSPRETLEQIVRVSVAHAIEESALVVMAEREGHHLPPAVRRRTAQQRRKLVDAWVDALRRVRADLDADQALAVVVGVAALITSSSRIERLSPERAQPLYERMAMAALLAR